MWWFFMEITINLKTVSTIVAIVAVIIGIIEGLNVFSLSGLVPDFVFYWSLAIIIAILGLLGVYISKMDIRIAAIQYIILGLGLFIAIGYYGVIGCVIFIVAGVLAIAEYVQTKDSANAIISENMRFVMKNIAHQRGSGDVSVFIPEVPIIIIAVMVIANSTNAITHSIISSPI